MKNLNVRLPDDLHARLRAAAAAEHRSLNAEIVHRLEQSFPIRENHDHGTPIPPHG